MIVAILTLILVFAFVAFTVDLGLISMHRSKMQGSVDAAALAAAMEISHAVESAPPEAADIVAYAKGEAANKAAEVALMNGYFVDPDSDVVFGARTFDETSGQFTIDWNIPYNQPANVVKVTSRKENDNLAAPDGKLRLFFAGVIGADHASLRTEAAAFVESRDIVVVHDFSRSMNFDSYYSDETANQPDDAQIYDNLLTVWNDLQPLNVGNMQFAPQHLTVASTDPSISLTFRSNQVDVASAVTYKTVKLQFSNGSQQSFNVSGTNGTFQGTGSNATRDITNAWVTWTEEGSGQAETLTGQSASGCRPQVTVTFSADRKSVYVVSSKDLSNVVLKFDDNVTHKFDNLSQGKTGTFQGIGGNSGKKIKTVWVKSGCNSSSDGPGYGERFNHPNPSASSSQDVTRQFADNNSAVKSAFGLDSVPYPFPSGSWDEYIDVVRTNSKLKDKGYAEKYGGLTFVQYLLRYKSSFSQTPPLCVTKHYPFHAIKLGHNLLCDFLEDLGFNDYLGMVSYDTYHRVEVSQSGLNLPEVDISSEPLGLHYQEISDLMAYKQANHYYPSTNIGGGMRDAILLLDDHKRTGARPNIVLMTDGNANITDGPTALPGGLEAALTGYDGPGSSYTVGSSSALRSLWYEVDRAVQKGYTIHTIAVGSDADWRTMKAIAHYAKGEFIWVPGGTSTEQMEAGLMGAFHKIAGLVPPAKLLPPE